MFEAYSDYMCQGSSQTVNVWGNSCAVWPSEFRFVAVLAYGGRGQRLFFHSANNCWDQDGHQYWADGGRSDNWTVGLCLSFDGRVYSAVSSWARP